MYCIFKAKIRLSLSKYAPRHGDDARCDEPEPVDVEVDVDRIPPQVRHRVRRPRRHRHSSGRLVGARVVERDLKKDINLSVCWLIEMVYCITITAGRTCSLSLKRLGNLFLHGLLLLFCRTVSRVGWVGG